MIRRNPLPASSFPRLATLLAGMMVAFVAAPRAQTALVSPEVRDLLEAASVYVETRYALSPRDSAALADLARATGGSFARRDTAMEASGSGFLVSPDGLIVTNAHVLDAMTFEVSFDGRQFQTRRVPNSATASPPDPRNPRRPFLLRFQAVSVKVATRSGSEDERVFSPTVLRMDSTLDVALLRIPGEDLPHLELDRESEIRSGLPVLMCGFPGGKLPDVAPFVGGGDVADLLRRNPRPSLNAGMVTSIREKDGRRIYQLDIRANHGNSGGPIALHDGRVVGVIYAGIDSMQSVGYAIPATDLPALEGDAVEPEEKQSYEEFLESGSFSFGGSKAGSKPKQNPKGK